MLARTDFPPRAMTVFEDVKLVNHTAALQLAADLSRKDKELEVKLAREKGDIFRANYERAYDMARQGH